jgi:hypothetical protein
VFEKKMKKSGYFGDVYAGKYTNAAKEEKKCAVKLHNLEKANKLEGIFRRTAVD